jgi:hypothetical protein
MPPSLTALVAAAFVLQSSQPLKKSDLIRLLSAATLGQAEIADLVRRQCLSFVPTPRDRADLRSLGAGDGVMRRVDECARRATQLRVTPRVRGVVSTAGSRAAVTVDARRGDAPAAGTVLVLRGSGALVGAEDARATSDARGAATFRFAAGAAAGTYQLVVGAANGETVDGSTTIELTVRPAPPAPLTVAPSRTGFVSGTGQRGRAGTRLPLPLVFEVRDTANAPVSGRAVVLRGTNAGPDTTVMTDATGRVQLRVTLGRRAGPAHVTAVVDGVERQAALVAVPGPAARLVVRCGGAAADGRLTLLAGADARVLVTAEDALGNTVPATDVRASVGDDALVRVRLPGGTAPPGTVVLTGVRAGSTNLLVLAAGLRASLVAAVLPVAAAGREACRGA